MNRDQIRDAVIAYFNGKRQYSLRIMDNTRFTTVGPYVYFLDLIDPLKSPVNMDLNSMGIYGEKPARQGRQAEHARISLSGRSGTRSNRDVNDVNDVNTFLAEWFPYTPPVVPEAPLSTESMRDIIIKYFSKTNDYGTVTRGSFSISDGGLQLNFNDTLFSPSNPRAQSLWFTGRSVFNHDIAGHMVLEATMRIDETTLGDAVKNRQGVDVWLRRVFPVPKTTGVQFRKKPEEVHPDVGDTRLQEMCAECCKPEHLNSFIQAICNRLNDLRINVSEEKTLITSNITSTKIADALADIIKDRLSNKIRMVLNRYDTRPKELQASAQSLLSSVDAVLTLIDK